MQELMDHSMRLLFAMLILAAPAVEAEIYRCETPQGLVFADRPCGEQAEEVIIDDNTSGVSPGPSEEVRDYLADKREQRSNERAERQQAQASRPPATVVIPPQQDYGYPVYWPYRGHQRPPMHRPGGDRPLRPAPHPAPGGSVLRPRGG